MPSPRFRFLRLLTLVVGLAASRAPARALVGAEPDGRFADRVAMVLIRGGDKAGFCTGLVLSPRILLTAAHCLRPLRDMAVYYRDAAGAAVIIPVDAAIAHPLYRADAIKARVESIDLALIRTARPLGPRFAGAAIADGGPPPIGSSMIVSGYGAAREGDWASGGTLRSVTLAVREPASKVLIWAADPAGRAAGACSGDSGAPDMVGGRIGRDRDRRLGASRAWARLRRLDARAAARAAERLDRGDRKGAQVARIGASHRPHLRSHEGGKWKSDSVPAPFRP